MSIARMEHIAVLVPAHKREAFVEWLYGRRELHVEPFEEGTEDLAGRFDAAREDASASEEQFTRLAAVASFLDAYRTDKGGFLEGIFPMHTVASRQEIREALAEVNAEELSEKAREVSAEIDAASEERDTILAQRERMQELSFLDVELRKLLELRHLSFHVLRATGEGQMAFERDERLAGQAAVEVVAETARSRTYLLAGPTERDALLKTIIADYGLQTLWLPSIEGTIEQEISRLDGALVEAEESLDAWKASAGEFAREWARRVDLARAWWDSERRRIRAQGMMVGSRNLFAARGYIQKSRLAGFRRDLASALGEASVVVTPAPEGEEPPVHVEWGRFFKPAGLLVSMFGLPVYRSIDPTVYLTLTFLMFFGICFGDVLYGAMLIALSLYMMKRYRQQAHLTNFFMLFLYAGVATMFFGFVMGAWGANLPAYLGEGNRLEALRQRMMLLDPLERPLVGLIIVIAIGIVNQLYGLFIRVLRDTRRGDWASGFYDGVLWIFYLVSLMSTAVGALAPVAWLLKPALVVLATSAAGLVLTQGRDQKGLFAKAIAGIVSLYGITGNYGTTAFLGDVVSYSRLLALALTTSVLGFTFNIIADMLRNTPGVGWLLFVLVLVAGHTFNFTVSVLGAFVHSARLILLEWFGRFYESGGAKFRPFGFSSDLVDVREARAERAEPISS